MPIWPTVYINTTACNNQNEAVQGSSWLKHWIACGWVCPVQVLWVSKNGHFPLIVYTS